jgi:hypothetical protein
MPENWIDKLVAEAMTEVQRNAVPVIRRLITEAQAAPTSSICSFDSDCEACQ